jgi:predicted kinase
MKVILLIGLLGSGKSTYGKSFIKENVYFFDEDLSKINNIPVNAEIVIFAHPLFCIKEKLNQFKEKISCKIEEIYFENDPEQCLKNTKNRDGKPCYSSITYLTKQYIIPNNAYIKKCYK